MDVFECPIVAAEPQMCGWGRVTAVTRGDLLTVAVDRNGRTVRIRVHLWGVQTTAPTQPLKADRRRVHVAECLGLFTSIVGFPVDFTGVGTPGKVKSVTGCLLRMTPVMVWFEGRGVDRFGTLLADVWPASALEEKEEEKEEEEGEPGEGEKDASLTPPWCPPASEGSDDTVAGRPATVVEEDPACATLEDLLGRFAELHPTGITGVWDENTN